MRRSAQDYIDLIDATLSVEKDECIFWPLANGKTAAKFSIAGKVTTVARFVCEREHGPAPHDGLYAAHRCGNGHLTCINPRHLRWSTPKENSADMIGHGTIMRGKRNHMTRLKESSVVKIKQMIKDGEPDEKIARIFKRHPFTIRSIRERRSWGWLEV